MTPGITDEEITVNLTEQDRATREVLRNEMAVIHRQQARAGGNRVYSCVAEAHPGISRLLARGNPADARDTVMPAGIAVVTGPNSDFGLSPDAPDSDHHTSSPSQ